MFKKRFTRRRRAFGLKRRKADVLHLSLCSSAVTVSSEQGFLDCDRTFKNWNPIAMGSAEEALANVRSPGAAPLGTWGTRGATISRIQFDLNHFASCWITDGVESCADYLDLVAIVHCYQALIKCKFDYENYLNTGAVVPLTTGGLPTIIHGQGQTVPTPFRPPLTDNPVDIVWRWMDVLVTNPCCQCTDQDDAGCPAPAGGLIEPINLRNSTRAAMGAGIAHKDYVRRVIVRNRRFLKEDEAIFYAREFVAGIPDNAHFTWITHMYGNAAVRIAR